ncbi:MAG: hypothetical protein Q8R43_00345, partial [Alphaproteobacteria bacterium]|nr:hypothetical protein [Alphaproteobacteria bacterium]
MKKIEFSELLFRAGDGALPTTIPQCVSSPRHHNAIRLVFFKKSFLKNLHIIPGIPSLFKLEHISHSAVLLYIQNRHRASDAPT